MNPHNYLVIRGLNVILVILKTRNIFPLLHEQNYFIFRRLSNFSYTVWTWVRGRQESDGGFLCTTNSPRSADCPLSANTSPWVKAALVMLRRPRCWSITDFSPLRLKMLRMEKSPPKGLILSDLSCIFAVSELAYTIELESTQFRWNLWHYQALVMVSLSRFFTF